MSQKTRLQRFDLLLPSAAIKVIREQAAIKGVTPRTMGRLLIVEKVKDLIGLAPDAILQDVDPAQASHTATLREGAEYDNPCL